MKAIIADDEANLRSYLQRLLEQVWPELDVVGSASNGVEALELASSEQPEIIFLDIRMPGLTGLEVAARLPAKTKIVFTTAYDTYAVNAFEKNAVDYLLKPITQQRLQQTKDKVENQYTAPERTSLDRLIEVIGQTETPNHLQWLRTGRQETTELIHTEQVVYFQADHKYTSVYTANDEHFIRTSIKDLETQLDPNQFWRINRGIIVKVSEIIEAKRDIRGRYTLSLRGRQEQIRSSQKYGYLFKLS